MRLTIFSFYLPQLEVEKFKKVIISKTTSNALIPIDMQIAMGYIIKLHSILKKYFTVFVEIIFGTFSLRGPNDYEPNCVTALL